MVIRMDNTGTARIYYSTKKKKERKMEMKSGSSKIKGGIKGLIRNIEEH